MSNPEIRRSLERLRAYTSTLHARAPEAGQHVEQLVADLERHLATPGAIPPDALIAGLTAAIQRFEVEHPALTASLQHVLYSLSSMGI
ncbi:MAG: DUF4404 family protein [Nevskia sp.]|jgi:hypothetical protein|nr:DUF4404 family protein [Nevskia sp.]MCK9385626.1 DUF4404 family protein [Nevskia sp.]